MQSFLFLSSLFSVHHGGGAPVLQADGGAVQLPPEVGHRLHDDRAHRAGHRLHLPHRVHRGMVVANIRKNPTDPYTCLQL